MPSVVLTYAELAARIGRSEIAAKSLAKRKRWKRSTGNDGLARITVDEADLADMANPDRRGIGRPPANATWTKATEPRSNPVHELQAKLAVAQALAAERERELGSIRVQLAAAETKIAETEGKLAAAQNELVAVVRKTGASEAEIAALQVQVTEARADRDAWRRQAQTLALTDQTKPGAPVTVPSVALEPRRPWWRRLVRA